MQNEKSNFVIRILAMLVIGILVLLSATLNAKYWAGQAPSPDLAQLFAGASFIIDLLKPMTPFWIAISIANRKPIAFLSGVLLLISCTAFSMVSAIGLSAIARYDGGITREGKADEYANLKNQRTRVEHSISTSTTTRHPDEIIAQMNAVLSEPLRRRRKSYGTVGSRSNSCTKSERYSRKGCARFAKLKVKKAAALARQSNIARLSDIDNKLETLRAKGLVSGADPQANVFASILDIDDLETVRNALIFLFAWVLEYAGLIAPFLLFQSKKTEDKKKYSPPPDETQEEPEETPAAPKLKPFVAASSTVH